MSAHVIAVQEVAGYGGLVEDIFVVQHHLPTVLIGEDQRQVDVGVTPNPVIGVVVEDTRPGIILPVVIASKRARPIRGQRHRVLCAERHRERRCIR